MKERNSMPYVIVIYNETEPVLVHFTHVLVRRYCYVGQAGTMWPFAIHLITPGIYISSPVVCLFVCHIWWRARTFEWSALECRLASEEITNTLSTFVSPARLLNLLTGDSSKWQWPMISVRLEQCSRHIPAMWVLAVRLGHLTGSGTLAFTRSNRGFTIVISEGNFRTV